MSKINFMPCVYRIYNNNHPNVCYIGSTNSFKSRMSYHKFQCKQQNNALLYKSIVLNGGIKCWTFEILKEFYGMSKEDLRKEEDKFMDLFNPPLNKNRAFTSNEEKKEINRNNARNFRKNKMHIKEHNEKNLESLRLEFKIFV